MIVSRLFILSALVAVIGLGPLVADAASLSPIQSVAMGESGSAHRVDAKRSESRQTIHQLYPEQIERSILRVLEQEMAGKVRAVHAVVIDPLDPMKVPSGDMSLRILPSGVEGGLGRRVFHIQVDMNGKSWQTIDAIAVSLRLDAWPSAPAPAPAPSGRGRPCRWRRRPASVARHRRSAATRRPFHGRPAARG